MEEVKQLGVFVEVREGQRFGSWLTVSSTKLGRHRSWACKCDCGITKIVREFTLKSRSSPKCKECFLKRDHHARVNIMNVREGQRFGGWTTISPTKKDAHHAWECRCDCGTTKIIIENVLRSGKSDRCRQCYLKGPRVPHVFLHEVGHRFGKLVIIDRFKLGQRSMYSMQCDCGTTVMMQAGIINFHKNQMCRKCALASRGHTVHGKSHSSTYSVWEGMKRRCNNPKSPKYQYYGGKGVRVCERWDKFPNFLEDMGERPEGLVIDRIDSNGNYEPGNCRWITAKENNDRAHEVRMKNKSAT